MGLFGTTWDDPRTLGFLNAASGLLNNTGSFGEGLGGGLSNFLAGYQTGKQGQREDAAAKREEEAFLLKKQEYERQLAVQRKQEALWRGVAGLPQNASLSAGQPPLGSPQNPQMAPLQGLFTPEQQSMVGLLGGAGYDPSAALFEAAFPDPVKAKDLYDVEDGFFIDYSGDKPTYTRLPQDELAMEQTRAEIAASNARAAASNATAANAGNKNVKILTEEEEQKLFKSKLPGRWTVDGNGMPKQIEGTAPKDAERYIEIGPVIFDMEHPSGVATIVGRVPTNPDEAAKIRAEIAAANALARQRDAAADKYEKEAAAAAAASRVGSRAPDNYRLPDGTYVQSMDGITDVHGNLIPPGARKMEVGKEPPATDSVREAKIADYVDQGLTRFEAAGVVDGRYTYVPDNVYGGYTIIDAALIAQGKPGIVSSTVGKVPKEMVAETIKEISALQEVKGLAGSLLEMMDEPAAGFWTEGRKTGATGTGLEGWSRRLIGSTAGQIAPEAVSESTVRMKERADRLKSIAARIFSANPNRTLAVEMKAAADKISVGMGTSRMELETQLGELMGILDDMITHRQGVLDSGSADGSGDVEDFIARWGLLPK